MYLSDESKLKLAVTMSDTHGYSFLVVFKLLLVQFLLLIDLPGLEFLLVFLPPSCLDFVSLA